MRIGIVQAFIAVLIGCAPGAALAERPQSRYGLMPGMEIRYTVKSELTGRHVSDESSAVLTVYVIDVDASGVATVIASYQSSSAAWIRQWKVPPSGPAASSGIGDAHQALAVFPPLIEPGQQVARNGYRFERAASPADKRVLRITGPYESMFEVRVDVAAELVDGTCLKSRVGISQRRGFAHESQTVYSREGVTQHKLNWARELRSQWNAYLAFVERYEEVLLVDRRADGNAWVKNATQIMDDASAAISSQLLARTMHEMRKNHESRVGEAVALAKREAQFVGKHVEWKAADLHGNRYSSKGLSGTSYVLEFGHRRCGYCLQLVRALRASDLDMAKCNLFFVSVDRMRDDADIVANAMELKRSVLFGTQLEQQFGVTAYPTTIVVGRDGNVIGARVGYSVAMAAWLRAVSD